MKKTTTLALLVIAATTAGLAQEPKKLATPAPTFVKCGSLIDGKSEEARRNVVIRVAGEKVEEIGTAAPAGAAVIDLSDETCLPGLIDTHTHLFLQGDITAEDYDKQLLKESIPYRTIRATQSARKALEYGFTAIRDVETEGAMYADVDLKKAVNAGIVPGPAILRRSAARRCGSRSRTERTGSRSTRTAAIGCCRAACWTTCRPSPSTS
jgi:imidazolonepropionase-like amidohydrolase